MATDHPRYRDRKATPSAPRSQPLVCSKGDDRCWKGLTEQANKAYALGDIDRARAAYESALIEAERLFEAVLFDTAFLHHGCLPTPVIYNIACHNMAELNEKQGKLADAEAYLRRTYYRLRATAQSPSVPLTMRVLCVQHMKYALAALVHHLNTHACGEEAVDCVIAQARETAMIVFRVARQSVQADFEYRHFPVNPS